LKTNLFKVDYNIKELFLYFEYIRKLKMKSLALNLDLTKMKKQFPESHKLLDSAIRSITNLSCFICNIPLEVDRWMKPEKFCPDLVSLNSIVIRSFIGSNLVEVGFTIQTNVHLIDTIEVLKSESKIRKLHLTF